MGSSVMSDQKYDANPCLSPLPTRIENCWTVLSRQQAGAASESFLDSLAQTSRSAVQPRVKEGNGQQQLWDGRMDW